MRYKLWSTVVVLLLTCGVNADPPRVEKKDNHWSPLMAEVTFKDPKAKPAKLMIYGIGNCAGSYTSHTFELLDADAPVTVWLDTIAEIKEIDDKRLTIVSKDGKERDFRYSNRELLFYQPDDSQGLVLMAKVKAMKFTKVPRADKEKNAMFDHWRYSPFTGEKLPQVEDK